MNKNIIYEDDHIIVVQKPAGIATQTARTGQQDMVSELKNYLAGKPGEPGKERKKKEPYLGVVHRLDQPVSGLLVFAKTKEAAANLSRQVTQGQMQKYYYAVVLGKPDEEEGRLEHFLYKDGRTNQSMVVKEDFPDAKKAILEYRLIKCLHAFFDLPGEDMVFAKPPEVSLLEIKLITGRHHQIRVQLSGEGMPILGDGKYGSERSKLLSREAGCKSTALCAYKLSLVHPMSKKKMEFEIQPEEEIFLPFFSKGI